MAPPNLKLTPREIKDQLHRLIKNRTEVNALLEPDVETFDKVRNIRAVFPKFEVWFDDFDDHPSRDLKEHVSLYRQQLGKWQGRIKNDLERIYARFSGRAVLEEIGRAKARILRIRPWSPKDTENYGDNATADAAEEEDATHVGMPILDSDGAPLKGSGTGKGSNVNVHFSASVWGVFSGGLMKGPGSGSDEVLLHEIIHASRMLRGVAYSLGVNQGYGNEEEYVAVVLTNVFLSEKKRLHLRASHTGFNVLKDPDKFLDSPINLRPRMMLERLRLVQSAMFGAIAAIDPQLATFNPVRQYNEELKSGKARAGELVRR